MLRSSSSCDSQQIGDPWLGYSLWRLSYRFQNRGRLLSLFASIPSVLSRALVQRAPRPEVPLPFILSWRAWSLLSCLLLFGVRCFLTRLHRFLLCSHFFGLIQLVRLLSRRCFLLCRLVVFLRILFLLRGLVYLLS